MTEALASWGPWAYVVLLALSAGESSAFLGLAVPGETFVLLAGALAARGDLALSWILAAVIVGAVLGDSIGYALGKRFGACGEGGWRARVWSCQRMTRVRSFLSRHGASTIFLARFVGFFRTLVPFAAGAAGMPYRPFLAYNLLGAVVWGTGTVGAGYVLGPSIERGLRAGGLGLVALLALGGLLVAVLRRRGEANPNGEGKPGPESPVPMNQGGASWPHQV